MLPAVVAATVPIVTGDAKEPVAFDNCAVNTFPAVKGQLGLVSEYCTLKDAPAQNVVEPVDGAFNVITLIVRGPELFDALITPPLLLFTLMR